MAAHNPRDRANTADEVWLWLEPRYREHRSQLYHFALGVLGNREDAEDATQIALLNAHRALVRGVRPSRPRAWLFAIALNACRRLLRARARRTRALVTTELYPPQPGIDAPTGAEISHAVASLPQGQREIFLLRELHGLSYAELSERLGLSTAAAESLLARARRRLREQLTVPEESPDLEPRRRPLLGIPGAYAVLRVVRGPTALKLAGLVGAAAIAPVVVIGPHLGSDRSPHAVSPAVSPAASPAAPRAAVNRSRSSFVLTHARPARRESTRPATVAPTIVRPASHAAPVAVRSSPLATDQPTPAAAQSPEASPEQPPAPASRPLQVVVKRPSAVAVEPQQPALPPAVESLPTSGPAPVPDTDPVEVVDEAVTTVQGAVDELPPAVTAPTVPTPTVPTPTVPTPTVPTPPALDPVQDALPDPLP
jgi:RNA polymerase sigma-70 factor (ECF subfamily)